VVRTPQAHAAALTNAAPYAVVSPFGCGPETAGRALTEARQARPAKPRPRGESALSGASDPIHAARRR